MFLRVYTVICVLALMTGYIVNGDDYEFPEGCNNELFCDKKPYFYDDLVGELDEKVSGIKEIFNYELFDEIEMEDDLRDDYNGQNCVSLPSSITPYMVNVSNSIKLVVQTDLLKQKINQRVCAYDIMKSSSSSAQCFSDISNTITGKCEQKFSTISLYLYDVGNKQLQRYPVNVPVCCHCVIDQ